MPADRAARTLADHKHVFDQIWTQRPEKQNRTSSSWWFFILFPEGEDGYGPRQMMFSIAARMGEEFYVNDTPVEGMDPNREITEDGEEFGAISVGWHGDDEQVDDHLINRPARARLSREGEVGDGSIEAWSDETRPDGQRMGSEIRPASSRDLGLEAEFVGERGTAKFEAWGDMDSRLSAPDDAMNMDTRIGGLDIIAWRRMQFEGEFDLPRGTEQLSGWCYFQRVCLNIPLHPWKWVWAAFPDGTAFSVMIPYLGPQLFRKGYKFNRSETIEHATVPVRQSGMWDWGDQEYRAEFTTARVKPILDGSEHPDFKVKAYNDEGDIVEFVAETYGHTRNHIDRPILGGLTESHWSYNEYLFQLRDLQATIDGEAVSDEDTGQAYGTLEYSTGMGL